VIRGTINRFFRSAIVAFRSLDRKVLLPNSVVSMLFGKLFCWDILLGLTDKNHSKTQDTFIRQYTYYKLGCYFMWISLAVGRKTGEGYAVTLGWW
jgi:hypothetical protein